MTAAVVLAGLVVVAPDGTANGALQLPRGTTAQRPAEAVVGLLRFNTTTNEFEIFDPVYGWVRGV
jgi:hypothetical protein